MGCRITGVLTKKNHWWSWINISLKLITRIQLYPFNADPTKYTFSFSSWHYLSFDTPIVGVMWDCNYERCVITRAGDLKFWNLYNFFAIDPRVSIFIVQCCATTVLFGNNFNLGGALALIEIFLVKNGAFWPKKAIFKIQPDITSPILGRFDS